MRIALVYDCLYPHTVGGAERCYRDLAERLARRHTVTYVTRRQWVADAEARPPAGVSVVCVSGGAVLYSKAGRRRIALPLRFGWGVFRHLLAHRGDYDVVHLCAFPYFSVLAARLVRALGGAPLLVDWYEVWTLPYWRSYLGAFAGRLAYAVEQLCMRATATAVVFSRLHAERLRERGCRARLHLLRGGYWAGAAVPDCGPRRNLVVYLGRHIDEKRVTVIPAALALARRAIPDLRAVIFGDGPTRPAVLAEIERLGLRACVDCPGFAAWEEVDAALRSGLCLLLPSRREGYGLVVVEAAARGMPAIVARAADSAAAELIEEGRNGLTVDDASPQALAAAIATIHAQRERMHAATRQWFAEFYAPLAGDAALRRLESIYTQLAAAAPESVADRSSRIPS